MLVVMSDTTKERGVLAVCHRGKGSVILLSFPSQHLALPLFLVWPKPDQGVIRVNTALICSDWIVSLCSALRSSALLSRGASRAATSKFCQAFSKAGFGLGVVK